MRQITDTVRYEFLVWHLAEMCEAFETEWREADHLPDLLRDEDRRGIAHAFFCWSSSIPHPTLRKVVELKFEKACQ